MQSDGSSLPMLSAPHDVFRHGLGTLKEDIRHQHVVEAIQKTVGPQTPEHVLVKFDSLAKHTIIGWKA